MPFTNEKLFYYFPFPVNSRLGHMDLVYYIQRLRSLLFFPVVIMGDVIDTPDTSLVFCRRHLFSFFFPFLCL